MKICVSLGIGTSSRRCWAKSPPAAFSPATNSRPKPSSPRRFPRRGSTISRAIRDLKNKGLLNRQRRGGTHIALPQSQRIALFTPFTRSASDLGYIGGQIHAHLSDLAARRGDHLRLQIIDAGDDCDRLEPMLAAARALIQQGVAGVFYYPAELPREQAHYNQAVVERLQMAGIAVIVVDRDIVAPPDRSALHVVTYDNRRGGHLITRHLIQQGRKRIAFIGTPYVSSVGSARLRGYIDALQDHGLPIDTTLIRHATMADLNEQFCGKLLREARPDAIVCKMDHYAAVVSRHLVNLGLTIGSDVLLAGFDDEPFAELLPVPLTTIRFPADPFCAKPVLTG
ncbi:MAG: substrate-binding domain-containing protein [Tepidisphaeraceae bacterium]